MKTEATKHLYRLISFVLFIILLMSTVFSQGVNPVYAQDEIPTDGPETAITVTPTVPDEESTETVTPEPEQQDPTASPTVEVSPTGEVLPTSEVTLEPTVGPTLEPTLETTTAPVCYPLTLQATEGQGTLVASTPQNCEGGYIEGTTVTITATVAEGYMVAGWQGTIGDESTALENMWIANSNAIVVLVTKEGDASGQIISGVEVSPQGKYPWIVALIKNSASNLFDGQICGGSLISADTVITAAHCVYGKSTTYLDIVAGIHNLSSGTGYQRVHIKRIFVYPWYNPVSYDNDIAIIKLQSSVTLGGSGSTAVGLIPLISSATLPSGNSTVAGWGSVDVNGQYYPSELREVSLPIISNSVCNNASHYNGAITGNMICAGYDTGIYDSCSGDSGGPLFFNNSGYVLAGIVSWGDGCAQPYKPGVYTRVYNYLSWINSFNTNDDIDNATNIVIAPSVTTQNTSGAYYYSDDPATNSCSVGAGNASVWYKYTPATTREVSLDTFGSNYDTKVVVFSGTRGALTEVACNDNANGGSQSQVSFAGTAGTTYYVMISQRSSSQPGGNLVLHATTFADVPGSLNHWRWIEGFYNAGITTGCGTGPFRYCPTQAVTRAEMSVFILRAKHGSTYVPPATTNIFSDVPYTGKEWMQKWVEQFYREGITTGCGADPLRYCPEQPVTRAEMAVFILRAVHGASYVPPATTGIFSDVPVTGKEWMQAWVEQFYREGITTGCGADPLRFCPEQSVTRADMAVFISRAYSIAQKP